MSLARTCAYGLLIALGLAYTENARAQELNARNALGLTGARPVITILGTYHWANPNLDAVKSNYEDPRSPKRQAEVRQLLEKLKAFKPTKIALEQPYGSPAAQDRYARYLKGEYELSANETDQVGLRLAKELGHATVYPFDVRLGMDMDAVMKAAAANGQTDKLQAMQRAFGEIAKWQAAQASMTILEALRQHNDPALIREGQAFYTYMAEIGKDTSYVGADVVVRWYERNLKMAANLLRIASSPSDRVLVLVGSGHAYWLHEILATSPSVAIEPSITYLR